MGQDSYIFPSISTPLLQSEHKQSINIDQLKSTITSDRNRMEMMLMDKLPDSMTGACSDTHLYQACTPNCTNIAAIQHFMESQTPHAINFPSNSISFSCGTNPNPAQELSAEAFMCSNDTSSGGSYETSQKKSSMSAMREMIFRIAAIQPIHVDPESIKPPKRRNVKISKDPQSVAARHRRERISQRIRILQRLVPGGTKMDTASMLDEAIHYVKFLKSQVQSLERAAAIRPAGLGFPVAMSCGSYLPMGKAYQPQNVQHFYRDA